MSLSAYLDMQGMIQVHDSECTDLAKMRAASTTDHFP